MKIIKIKNTESNHLYIPIVVCSLTLIVSIFPYLIQGKQSLVVAHDHLDSVLVWATVLARESQIFAKPDDIVSPILGGIERRYFGSPYQLYYALFAIFQPFTAMVISELLSRIIAFTGMYLLVSSYVADSPTRTIDSVLSSLISACFALLPFWPPAGAAVAGLPLFFWAALKARGATPNQAEALAISCSIAIFVFYGSLILSGVFALAVLSTLIVWDVFRRDFARAARLFSFNLVASLAFIWQNRWLLTLGIEEETSRSEMSVSGGPTSGIPDFVLRSFLDGQYHADPGTAWPIYCVVSISTVAAAYFLLWRKEVPRQSEFILLLTLIILLFTAVMHGMYRWNIVQGALTGTILKQFNFGRFHWLQPALWGVVFAAAIFSLQRIIPWRKVWLTVVLFLTISQISILTNSLPIYSNSSFQIKQFEGYFASSIFEQIKIELADHDNIRLGLVGMHPAIAQFNGFDTVGGYLPIYSLKQKHEFREIISNELDKDSGIRSYFDAWGSRAYLFSSDQSRCRGNCFKQNDLGSIELDYDTDRFLDFGGTHIASTNMIENSASLGLNYLGEFEDNSPTSSNMWKLYLYGVQDDLGTGMRELTQY